TLPRVLSAEELTAFFAALRKPKYRALFTTCYAAGLRLGEVCRLQVRDIDSKRMVIQVRAGKGKIYGWCRTRLLQGAPRGEDGNVRLRPVGQLSRLAQGADASRLERLLDGPQTRGDGQRRQPGSGMVAHRRSTGRPGRPPRSGV